MSKSKRHTFGVLGYVSRSIGWLFDQWKLVLIGAYFITGTGQHLRWEYEYRSAHGYRAHISCTYLGPRGFIMPETIGQCPVLVWMDARLWVKS